ncbi:hypothetical protein BCR44DRAFT_1432856 [Catenaria anguillulae PL171]|uniref:Secreted protein n=1 Tax=Catenaria anguillulae PL171 TaxID=765915 RepID=A0A1Y2HQP4_9FUNG|nr:hypothetical protein BCR44DRAFT_1432856 [Catenaria anguillulae PL171]
MTHMIMASPTCILVLRCQVEVAAAPAAAVPRFMSTPNPTLDPRARPLRSMFDVFLCLGYMDAMARLGNYGLMTSKLANTPTATSERYMPPMETRSKLWLLAMS